MDTQGASLYAPAGPSADMSRSMEEDSLLDRPLISTDALHSAIRREFQSIPTSSHAGLLSVLHFIMSRRAAAVRGPPPVDSSETELAKLQQQYRSAERDKQAYTAKTQSLIIRDQREIQSLQDEREELLRSLRVSESSFKRCTDASVVQDLTSMLVSDDRIDEELEAERANVASLKDQILKWERMLAKKRTGKETSRRSVKSEKTNLLETTFIMEKKLDRGHKYFNKVMTRNGELREELKLVLIDKKQFLHVKSRLLKELYAIRKDISKLRTQCIEAFSVSVKLQEKKRMLKEQNAKDVAHYLTERGNLEGKMSYYHNFEVFRDTKAIARSDQSKVTQDKLESKELGPEDFEEAVKKIFAATNESDLDTLVRNFIQMEEENYTLLKFVNHQQSEAETIRRQISELHKEREAFVAEVQRQQEQHQALWEIISTKQEAVNQQLEVYQHDEEKLLDQLKEGVESLPKISHDSTVISDQLESSDGNQEEVLAEYLRSVENRVNELLTVQSCCQFQENSSQLDTDSLSTITGHLLGISTPPDNLPSAAVTPAPAYDPDLVEAVQLEVKEPMNRGDVETLVNKRIQRQ